MGSNIHNLDWVMTYTGKIYYPFNPDPHDVCIEDVSHALSNLCRYTGMSRWFYSVAEHSVLVSYMVPPELALEGLLHDAAEAYCGDMALPLKKRLPDYAHLELINETAVRIHFGLPHAMNPIVKKADRDVVITEYECLFPPIPERLEWIWAGEKDPTVELKLWHPLEADVRFLRRYEELTKGKAA